MTELAPSRFGAAALFATVDRAGNVIDRGEPCDSSTSPAGAIEDTLDLLVKHYRP